MTDDLRAAIERLEKVAGHADRDKTASLKEAAFVLDLRLILDAARAQAEQPEWEWGTAYEVDSSTIIHEPEQSFLDAKRRAAESPTDTSVVRRRPAGPWEPVPSDERSE